MNNYGKLKDNNILTLKVYLFFLFVIRIICFSIFENLEDTLDKNNKNIKFAIKVIISVLVHGYKTVTNDILKGNPNNQDHIVNELKINFTKKRFLGGKNEEVEDDNDNRIYENLIEKIQMPELFDTTLETKLGKIIHNFGEDIMKIFQNLYYQED